MKKVIILWTDRNGKNHNSIWDSNPSTVDAINKNVQEVINTGSSPEVYYGEKCEIESTVQIIVPEVCTVMQDSSRTKIPKDIKVITCPICNSADWDEGDEGDNDDRHCINSECNYIWEVKHQALLNDAKTFLDKSFKLCFSKENKLEATIGLHKHFINGFLSSGKKKRCKTNKVITPASIYNRGINEREDYDDEDDLDDLG